MYDIICVSGHMSCFPPTSPSSFSPCKNIKDNEYHICIPIDMYALFESMCTEETQMNRTVQLNTKCGIFV